MKTEKPIKLIKNHNCKYCLGFFDTSGKLILNKNGKKIFLERDKPIVTIAIGYNIKQ
jgi:hypothetical protein